MNLFVKKIILSITCSFLISCGYTQVKVSLSVFPEKINKDEYATLKIVINDPLDLQQVTPPSLNEFNIVSGPNQESGKNIINGQETKFAALSYVLLPIHTGKIVIRPAIVKIGDKTYKTNATELFVKNALSMNGPGNGLSGNPFSKINPFQPSRPASAYTDYIFHKGESIADKVNKNMLLKVETDKTSCYVGEPVVATYKLFTRLKSESKLTGNPSFNGFSVIDLTRPEPAGYTKEKLNNREYNVYIIRKAQLYPLQPGTIELEPAELENNISFIKEEFVNQHQHDIFDLFDHFASASVPEEGVINQTVVLKSKPLSIIVKPLPEENKPASFKGAVGEFTLQTAIQKPVFAVTESGKLTVKINGKGNIQLIASPEVNWPAGLDALEPKASESLVKQLVPVTGYKMFEYNFTAIAPGNYTLPPIVFSFFDPHSATYKTLTTKPLSFTVTPATSNKKIISVPLLNPEQSTGINKIFDNRWAIIAFIFIMVLIGIIIYVKRDKSEKEETEKKQGANISEINPSLRVSEAMLTQENVLSKSKECLHDNECTNFYAHLNAELKQFISHKFLTRDIHINAKDLASILNKKNIPDDIVLALQELIEEIEWQLYTPFERNDKMQQLYNKAGELILMINLRFTTHQ